MRYYVKDSTLIIEGNFEAASTGLNGGRGCVNCLFNHQVPRTFNPPDPGRYVKATEKGLGLEGPCFGLLTAVKMEYLQVLKAGYLTVFVTAGVSNGSEFRAKNKKIGTINIILVSKEKLSETALFGAIITATEAKGLALLEKGYDFLGTNTDAVIVAYEKAEGTVAYNNAAVRGEEAPKTGGRPEIPYAGSSTEFGKKITKAVIEGVKAGLALRGE